LILFLEIHAARAAATSGRSYSAAQRTTPDVTGVLTRVSADLTREQQSASQPAQAYYTVRIGLPADQVARLKDIRLVPGMPVEAFIQTYDPGRSTVGSPFGSTARRQGALHGLFQLHFLEQQISN
jgi:hypothetical protein